MPLTRTLLSAIVVGGSIMSSVPSHAHEDDPWFARDKYLHGGVSAALALGGYAGASLVTKERGWRFLSGAVMALSVGAGKEVLDTQGEGDASWRDFTWDIVGTASGLALAWVLDTYVF